MPGTIATIRHRTASYPGDSYWEFRPKGGKPEEPNRIFLRISMGKSPFIEIEVPVCSNKNLLFQHWIMVRKSESNWHLSPAKVPMSFNEVVYAVPFHENLPCGSILLTDAPANVSLELSEV